VDRSDPELIRLIAQGDEEAFEALFTRHRAVVCQRLRGIVRDGDVADDLVQETFLRVWSRAETWTGSGSAVPWVLRIATNLALNHLRTLRRRREQSLEASGPRPSDPEEETPPDWLEDESSLSPDAILEDVENRRALQELANGLSEGKREVVRLLCDAEMDLREIAEELGVPEGTVKSRLHYATRELARKWKHYERNGGEG
jgi:RNA polymerase sigma-70 factor (ECF subfamily)